MTKATPPETPAAFRQVSRETLSDVIVEQIVEMISSSALKPGDRLPPERELCKTLGVGRTSVREALKPLMAIGVLDRRGSAGTFVAKDGQFLEKALEWGLRVHPRRVDEIVETRMMLETHTAYWAASRATTENLTTLSDLQRQMYEAIDDRAAFRELDVRFHLEIAQATQNSIMITLVNMMRRYFLALMQERLSAGQTQTETLTRVSADQHQAILECLLARDANGAHDAMAVHIETASRDLPTSP